MNYFYTIFMVLALGALTLAGKNPHKEYMLEKNKVPKPVDLSHILIRGANGQLAPIEEVQVRNENICDECKEVAGKIEEILKDKTKLDELKMLLRMACQYAGDYKQQCLEIVNNLDIVAQELLPLFADPEGFCKEIHLCGEEQVSRYHRLAFIYFKKYLGQVAGYSNDVICDECEFAVTELKTLLTDKSLQDEIKAGLHDICGYLGGSTAKECDDLVDEYFPALVQELEQLLNDPKGLCQMLGLCQGNKLAIQSLLLMPANRQGTPKLPSPFQPVIQSVRLESFMRMLSNLQTKQGNNVACLLCEMGLGGLINYVKDDDTLQQKVANGIQDVVCNKVLPTDYKPGCNDFVGLYLKSVLYMTLEQLDADKICDDLHACTAFDVRTLQTATPQMKSELVCESCELAAEFLKYELGDKTFQDEVVTELKKVCTVLPQSYNQQCVTLMEFYVPQVLEMLDDQLEPKKACTEVELCP
jgi:hypothetical protein